MAKKKAGSVLTKMYEKHRGAKRDDIPNGRYESRATRFTVKEGDEPTATLGFVVTRGEHKGQNLRRTYRLFDKDYGSWQLEGEVEFRRMMEDLDAIGIDTNEVDFDEIAKVIEAEKPGVVVATKKKGDFINVSVIKGIDSDDEVENEEDEEEVEADDEEEGDDEEDKEEVEESDEDEEEVEEDEEDEEEEGEPLPEKGDMVSAKPAGTNKFALYKVATVNTSKSTCTLVRESDGKKFANVPFDAIDMD